MKRHGAAVILLSLLTAVHAGAGLWRIGVMYQEGLAAGPRPLELTAGLLEEVGLSLFIALVAWWWLPRGKRTPVAWSLRFLVIAWTLAIGQMMWVLILGFFEHGVSWAILLFLFVAGIFLRTRGIDAPQRADEAPGKKLHPAAVGALIFWLLQLPHLFFSYHWTDTKDIWACRTEAFDATGGFLGIFDCLDPGRPPLHSVLLWLGHTNGTIEGRLLPFLMIGAFGLVTFHFLRRVAPILAPWGILWFFMTVRVYQGAVSSYADVPVMMAIAIGIFLALKDRRLVESAWQAAAFAIIAGMAAALIKRDGGALIFVATAVLWWFAPRRRDPLVYAALVGATLGFVVWSARPSYLYVESVFGPRLSQVEEIAPPPADLPVRLISQDETVPPIQEPDTVATFQDYVTMFYGMQGQMLSHYGFSMFVPTWIILAIWVWRRRERLSTEGRLYTWIAVLGWLAIVGIYVVHVATGHPYRGSLRVIRTAFGRHLVHMFVFALLSAAAMAEILVTRARARQETA